MSSKLKHDVGSIYKITCISNSKIYVGESLGTYSRWYKHRHDLRRGVHSNRHLQSAWLKEGEVNFKFEILEKLENSTKEFRLEREEYWCKFYDSYNNSKGYNNTTKDYQNGNARNTRTKEFKSRVCMKIYKITPDTKEIVKIFNSYREVMVEFNCSRKVVDKMFYGALLGKNKRRGASKGFIWIQENKYDLWKLGKIIPSGV